MRLADSAPNPGGRLPGCRAAGPCRTASICFLMALSGRLRAQHYTKPGPPPMRPGARPPDPPKSGHLKALPKKFWALREPKPKPGPLARDPRSRGGPTIPATLPPGGGGVFQVKKKPGCTAAKRDPHTHRDGAARAQPKTRGRGAPATLLRSISSRSSRRFTFIASLCASST